MERNKNKQIMKPVENKRRNGPGPDHFNYRKGVNETTYAGTASLHTGKNATDHLDSDTKDRQPTGEWIHPVTNQDEQQKITNAGNDDLMGEKETEGV